MPLAELVPRKHQHGARAHAADDRPDDDRHEGADAEEEAEEEDDGDTVFFTVSGELGVGALVAIIIGAVVCCVCSCAVLMFARYKLGQGHAEEEETKEDNAPVVNLKVDKV